MPSEDKRRWVRNNKLAEYLSITPMTLWRWQRDAAMGFPQPSIVRGMPYTDLDKVDRWMRANVKRASGRKTEAV